MNERLYSGKRKEKKDKTKYNWRDLSNRLKSLISMLRYTIGKDRAAFLPCGYFSIRILWRGFSKPFLTINTSKKRTRNDADKIFYELRNKLYGRVHRMALNIVFFGIKWVASKCIWYISIYTFGIYIRLIIERIDKMEWFGHLRVVFGKIYVFYLATMFFFCSAWTNWQHATADICIMFFHMENR